MAFTSTYYIITSLHLPLDLHKSAIVWAPAKDLPNMALSRFTFEGEPNG